MQFAEIPVADAEGAILAHTVAIGGLTLKKGRVLSAADVAALMASGRSRVFAARLDLDDIPEDVAAARLADALGGAGVRVAPPFTGRANAFADTDGLLAFDAGAIGAVNGIDESLTVATLAPNERVTAGQMVATIKVIPFAVRRAALDAAVAVAERARLVVHAFRPHTVGLVLTRLPQTKDGVLDKRSAAIAGRLRRLGSAMTTPIVAEHTPAAVAGALRRLEAQGASPLLVFSASAIVDRADVVPAGLVAAGGTIERLGMPVDPGNLLLLGRLAATPVIGIPSCAASPKANGFDWVLERALADLTITPDAIAQMGVGGLLKEIASRPQPRAGDGPAGAAGARQAPRIEAIILAAGRSTRMGANKLLEPLAGRPVVRHVIDAATRARGIARVIVVTGHQAEAVARAAVDTGMDLAIVHNPDFAQGMSTSLRAGLAALTDAADGAIILLGDMPEITSDHIDRLIAAFSPVDGRSIVVPTHSGRRGNPVLWGREVFAEMADLTGDTGAKSVLAELADAVAEVDLGSDAIFTDVDTPEALAAVRARRRPV